MRTNDVTDIDAAALHGLLEDVRAADRHLARAVLMAGRLAVRAVLFDAARPLAVAGKVRADTIPADTRCAVRARDLGCRFPGSTDPLAHTDVHHAIHREHGGDHCPENLISLSRRFHTLAHAHGWRLKVSPATGMVTARRRPDKLPF